jgi:hypothetical protein
LGDAVRVSDDSDDGNGEVIREGQHDLPLRMPRLSGRSLWNMFAGGTLGVCGEWRTGPERTPPSGTSAETSTPR